MHPLPDVLTHPLLEGEPEGAIATVSAFACQLLGGERSAFSNSLTIEIGEMVDAQVVDIGIVGDALTGEILAEIVAVGANGFGKLGDVQVVLQVELRVYAMVLQLLLEGGRWRILGGGWKVEGGGRKVAERLYPPQEVEDKHGGDNQHGVFINRGFVAKLIDGECQQYDGQHDEAAPYLLVLQVGIVVAQPAAILP